MFEGHSDERRGDVDEPVGKKGRNPQKQKIVEQIVALFVHLREQRAERRKIDIQHKEEITQVSGQALSEVATQPKTHITVSYVAIT